MFKVIRNAWMIPEVRKKMLYTLFIILLFRLGCYIPVPFIDSANMSELFNLNGGSLLTMVNSFTGGGLESASIFSLSITPYINSSIIMQLLCVAIPPLERMQKEEDGRKKIAKITRFVTIGFGLLLGTAYYLTLKNGNSQTGAAAVLVEETGFAGFFVAAVIVLCFTAGSCLIMWMGEQINEKGLGNGISMILFAGIVSRGPALITTFKSWIELGASGATKYYIMLPVYIILALAAVVLVVIMSEAERRIPVQYAQRVVGRRVYGGQNTHIPIKVNMTGVMPIIFASTLVALPGTIKDFFGIDSGFWGTVLGVFQTTSMLYAIIYFLLIVGFNYFYVSIQYDPIQISNNLQKNGGTIKGIRPGRQTSEYIHKVVSRVTLIGALLLGVIAVGPIFLSMATGVNMSLGGTSLLIMVGVALELVRTLESQMMMRHYKGFLE